MPLEKPRYVQRVQRGAKVYWRYNPPKKAVEAGVVEAGYLNKRKETAFTEANRRNRLLDKWREQQKMEAMDDPRKNTTLRGLAEFYRRSKDFECLSATSKGQYSQHLDTLMSMTIRGKLVGSFKYKELTVPMAQEIYDNLLDRGITSANRAMATIRRAYTVGIKHGLVERNPFSNMETKQEPERKVVWTTDHVEQLLDHAYANFQTRSLGLIVHMAYEWAQRVGDMANLTWDSVDLDNHVLTLTQSKRRATVKLPITEPLLGLLKNQKEDFGWQDYVAPNVNAKGVNQFKPYTPQILSHAARRLIGKAGLPNELRISDLRRTATVEMAEAGVEMAQIMSVTGHANPQSVKPYLKNTLTSASEATKLRLSTREVLHV